MTRALAAFDFDGTLTRRDTMLPFLATVAGWPRVLRALGAEARRLARDRDLAKEQVLVRLLAGMPHETVREHGRTFARTVAISPEVRERLDWHRHEGHDVVIVSASLDVYLHDVAHAIGVEHALCTSLEVDDEGRCTGRMLGANCRGPEKVNRLRAHLAGAHPFGLAGTEGAVGVPELWAYGDSRGDDEMLAIADHAVRVRRGRLRPAR